MSARAHAVQATTASQPNAPAVIMGVGLGGFVDGILLHQVLQWHHMLTGTGDQAPRCYCYTTTKLCYCRAS
jgi:uncharacterized membrane protein